MTPQAFQRCTYPVEGKPCGVYVPNGADYCRDHLVSLAANVGAGCCSPDHPCWEDDPVCETCGEMMVLFDYGFMCPSCTARANNHSGTPELSRRVAIPPTQGGF